MSNYTKESTMKREHIIAVANELGAMLANTGFQENFVFEVECVPADNRINVFLFPSGNVQSPIWGDTHCHTFTFQALPDQPLTATALFGYVGDSCRTLAAEYGQLASFPVVSTSRAAESSAVRVVEHLVTETRVDVTQACDCSGEPHNPSGIFPHLGCVHHGIEQIGEQLVTMPNDDGDNVACVRRTYRRTDANNATYGILAAARFARAAARRMNDVGRCDRPGEVSMNVTVRRGELSDEAPTTEAECYKC